MPNKGLASLTSEPGKKIDMAQYLIITTVGTSIFTNFNKEEVGKAFEEHKKDYTPLNLADHESDSAQEYDEDILGEDTKGSLENIIKSKWLKGIEKKTNSTAFYFSESADAPNPHASAEITSILKIAEKLRAQDEEAKVEVQLLATDTALSVSAAKLIRKYQWPEGITVRPFDQEADYIQSLGVKPPQGSDPESFYDEGLQNLVKKLVDNQTGLIKKAKEDDYDPVINFSGGYKAIIPFLTIIAQLEDIPMYYIYEDSEYLLEMGSLPVGWDWEVAETVAFALNDSVLEQIDPELPATKEVFDFLNKGKLINREQTLTFLGEYLRDYMERDGSTVSKNILGLFVEYKLFETFLSSEFEGTRYKPEKVTIYKNPDGSLTDQVSPENQRSAYCEIDLVRLKK